MEILRCYKSKQWNDPAMQEVRAESIYAADSSQTFVE